MFPVWFLQFIIFGGVVLCGLGAVTLIVFLILDMKDKRIW